MNKTTEYSNSTENIEVILGPSAAKSSISSKSINISVLINVVKNENNKIGIEETVEAAGKKMEELSLLVNRTPAMFCLSTEDVNEMVINSIMNIGNHDGASFADICKYMEVNYKANMELLDAYVENFLKNGVKNGFFERVKRTTGEERFKIKIKSENVEIITQNLVLKEEMDAPTEKLEKDAMSESENLRKKATAHPPTSLVIVPEIHSRHIKNESTNMTENYEAIPGPSITDTSKKRTKRSAEKRVTENKKRRITKAIRAKIVSAAQSKKLMRNPSNKIFKMTMDAVKYLKRRNGVTLEDIYRYLGKNPAINMKVIKPRVIQFLNKSVEDGVLQRLDAVHGEESYKIKKPETVRKESPNLSQNVRKVLSVRNKASPKKVG